MLLSRRAESFLAGSILNLDIGHQRNLKFYLAMYVTAAATKHAYVPPDKLLSIDVARLDNDLIRDCYARVGKKYQGLAEKFESIGEEKYDFLAKGPSLLRALNTELKRRYALRKKSGVGKAAS